MGISTLLVVCAGLTGLATQHAFTKQDGRPPMRFTLVVTYVSCTDCSDFYADSGEVTVPAYLRPAYAEARYKQLKLYGRTREQVQQQLAANGYHEGILRAATEASFDSLFTPPGRTRYDPIPESEDPAIQAGYWRRRYRLTGNVAGFDGRCLVFKVQTAVRLPDRADD